MNAFRKKKKALEDNDSRGYEAGQLKKEAERKKISKEKQKKRKEKEAYYREIKAIYRKKSKKKV
jgi:hypothetical protein